jgi:hypothetical protein
MRRGSAAGSCRNCIPPTQEGDRGRKASPVAHPFQQPPINRCEKHRHHDRPENGAIERLQNPGERQRDGDKQQQETLMFDPLHNRLAFVNSEWSRL